MSTSPVTTTPVNPFAEAEKQTIDRLWADFWRQVESFVRESDAALREAIADPMRENEVSRFILYPYKGEGLVDSNFTLESRRTYNNEPERIRGYPPRFANLDTEVHGRRLGLSLEAKDSYKDNKRGVTLTLKYSSLAYNVQTSMR